MNTNGYGQLARILLFFAIFVHADRFTATEKLMKLEILQKYRNPLKPWLFTHKATISYHLIFGISHWAIKSRRSKKFAKFFLFDFIDERNQINLKLRLPAEITVSVQIFAAHKRMRKYRNKTNESVCEANRGKKEEKKDQNLEITITLATWNLYLANFANTFERFANSI